MNKLPIQARRIGNPLRRFWRSVVMVSLALGLSACVTLTDFQNMTAPERARLVCQTDSEIMALSSNLRQTRNQIAEANGAIRQGYRSMRICERRNVQTSSTTTCETIKEDNVERVVCEEEVEYEKKRDCRDLITPVDVYQEQIKIERLTQLASRAQAELGKRTQSCFSEVLPLSPQEAYLRYRQ